jgi:hypothetical protein
VPRKRDAIFQTVRQFSKGALQGALERGPFVLGQRFLGDEERGDLAF